MSGPLARLLRFLGIDLDPEELATQDALERLHKAARDTSQPPPKPPSPCG